MPAALVELGIGIGDGAAMGIGVRFRGAGERGVSDDTRECLAEGEPKPLAARSGNSMLFFLGGCRGLLSPLCGRVVPAD